MSAFTSAPVGLPTGTQICQTCATCPHAPSVPARIPKLGNPKPLYPKAPSPTTDLKPKLSSPAAAHEQLDDRRRSHHADRQQAVDYMEIDGIRRCRVDLLFQHDMGGSFGFRTQAHENQTSNPCRLIVPLSAGRVGKYRPILDETRDYRNLPGIAG